MGMILHVFTTSFYRIWSMSLWLCYDEPPTTLPFWGKTDIFLDSYFFLKS